MGEVHIPGLYLDPGLSIIFLIFCIIMVAVLASSEAAVLSVNKIRIRDLTERGDKKAQAVSDLVKKPDKLFATILTIENMFIIVGSSVGTALAIKLFGENSMFFFSFILTILIVIFGEITPKTYAAINSEKVALFAAIPLKFLVSICSPIIYIFTFITNSIINFMTFIGLSNKDKQKSLFITESEIKMMIDLGSETGAIAEEESEILQNVFEFKDTMVNEIMTPRTQIVALPENATVYELLIETSKTKHRRFPVYVESLDDIKGIVFLVDVVSALAEKEVTENDTIENFIKPATFVPENKKVHDLLKMMREKGIQMAIIADEFGGTEGLVTLEDLVEEIIEIPDDKGEYTEIEEVQTIDKKTFVVQGSISIYDLNEELEIKIPESDKYQTIAGFILNQLNHIPTIGEKIVFNNLEIIVTEVTGPKIVKAKIIKLD